MALQQIKDGLEMLLDGQLADGNKLSSWAAHQQALPALFDMGGFFALRTDGVVLSASWDAPDTVRVEDDPRIRSMVFYFASQLHPSLSELKPKRGSTGVDCEHCGGTGRFRFNDEVVHDVVCYCGGLGWLPGP